jgi:hypothetical protein
MIDGDTAETNSVSVGATTISALVLCTIFVCYDFYLYFVTEQIESKWEERTERPTERKNIGKDAS